MKNLPYWLGVVLFICANIGYAGVQTKIAPIFTGVGQVTFPIDSHDALAQQYFNQGLAFFYGFDYEESIRSFHAATVQDPQCGLCLWGYALALGSLDNAETTGNEMYLAHGALQRADEISKTKKNPMLIRLVAALTRRYQDYTDIQVKKSDGIVLPYTNRVAYANAIHAISQAYPKNEQLYCLFAHSVFDVVRWRFWGHLANPDPYTLLAIAAVRKALAINPNNIGAIHFYIHATEWSPHPEDTLIYAERLSQLAPLLQHIVHMPAHVYLRMGNYEKAVMQNKLAIQAYQDYLQACKKQGFAPGNTFLNQHNYDFLFASAILQGDQDTALSAAQGIRQTILPAWLSAHPFQQRFFALRYWALAHFGLWAQALAEPKPGKQYPYLQLMWHYARGLAFSHAQKLNEAQEERRAVNKLSRKIMDHDKIRQFKSHARIVQAILAANIASAQNRFADAVIEWQRACDEQNNIQEGDPPQWYFQCYQGLGFALLRAGKPEMALAAFQADLVLYPKNIWSSYGSVLAREKMVTHPGLAQAKHDLQEAQRHSPLKLPLPQGNEIMI